ncbi:MAG: hypothetical protein RSC68_24560, partial [Acinetobacter sp.]
AVVSSYFEMCFRGLSCSLDKPFFVQNLPFLNLLESVVSILAVCKIKFTAWIVNVRFMRAS